MAKEISKNIDLESWNFMKSLTDEHTRRINITSIFMEHLVETIKIHLNK